MTVRAEGSSGLGEAGWLDPALVAEIRDDLLDHPGPVTDSAVAAAVRRSGRVLGSAAMLELVARLSAQLAGAGPLQPLLDRPGVTDVFVNGPRDVWADFGAGLEQVPLSLGAESDVRALAVRLAASGGRRLDDSSPLVDVRMPDGVRVNAVIPPLSGDVTVLSFRIPRPRAFTLPDLIGDGFVPAALVTLVEETVARRANFLISGGTGSGKTVLLGAMLSAADQAHRLLLVEDSRELVVVHPHVVQLSARQANVEGIGDVPMTALVRNALRMRPDRLVVGEVRGEEVRDMLTALNTGHEGGCATVHANTSAAVPSRLEALGALAGMSAAAVHAQTSTAIDLLLHLRRDGAGPGKRGIAEVAVPVLVEDRVHTRLVWDRATGFQREGVAQLQRTFSTRSAAPSESTPAHASRMPASPPSAGPGPSRREAPRLAVIEQEDGR
ncbi:TadA family conjugal transfer-associated ATPase [Brevibacterium jeotgali]|uniref:Pilus assembly protein CpaF n=1 Tax=Brevibacterium jeotgali TaxID=1262550 RepID=A0A2H1L1H2_9MICO|nr:TadA family conjugal transfer-associated ATPase [Brevibacterium jeotgali]TWC02019.1 pilus assembly protein CpaF [Brevibacterium jeotgali]SMY10630.1 pilus assembly protein CpaF [Brevibacterium jeotgali]